MVVWTSLVQYIFRQYRGRSLHPSRGNSSISRAQIFTEFSQKNRRKPQIGLRHLRSVTFSSALYLDSSNPITNYPALALYAERTPGLRHLFPVRKQILRRGHVPKKIVQNLCTGHSRQVPENLCERYAGTSKNVLGLCEIRAESNSLRPSCTGKKCLNTSPGSSSSAAYPAGALGIRWHPCMVHEGQGFTPLKSSRFRYSGVVYRPGEPLGSFD